MYHVVLITHINLPIAHIFDSNMYQRLSSRDIFLACFEKPVATSLAPSQVLVIVKSGPL